MNGKEYTIEKDGFNAVLFMGSKYPEKFVIRVGGSSTDKKTTVSCSKFLIDAGFTVLVLGYYYWEGMSRESVKIPLDYVGRAIERIKKDFGEKYKNDLKFAMTGTSQGAAYSLLCACYFHDISCVAAASPYDYVWEGTVNMIKRTHCSGFTYEGREIPYTNWSLLDENIPRLFLKAVCDKNYGLKRLLRFAYDNNPTDEKGRIPVEKMKARVLLLASDNDDCWPSEKAVPRIEKRLKDAGYEYEVKSVIYPHGSHILGGNMNFEPKYEKRLMKMIPALRKNPHGARQANSDSMAEIIDFFIKW